MAGGVICSKKGATFTIFGFIIYFIMKYLLIVSIMNVTVDIQTEDGSSVTVHQLAEQQLQKVINSSGDTPCDWDGLERPQIARSVECNTRDCDQITCRRLLVGDVVAVKAAERFTREYKRNILTDEEILRIASNCSDLIIRGGYKLTPQRQSDVSFPIAFNILLHKKLEQFERLLRAIYRPQNFYCIHVDVKSSWTFHAAVHAISQCFNNVFLATRRQRVVYAGFTRLQADIDCMKDHMLHQGKWRYLLNIAGQSYPIRTPEEMIDILRVFNGSNDVEGLPLKRRILNRFTKVWIEQLDSGKMVATNTTLSAPPHSIDLVRGSGYGIFSREFVEFIVNDKRAQDLLEWSRRTYSPDEHFFSTLHHLYNNPHLHTPGGYRGLPESKPFLAVYVKWYSLAKCAGRWKRGICILGVKDLPDLIPRKEFFVNKFDIDNQPLAFECFEAWLEHRVQCPTDFDTEYYRSLPHVIR